MKVMCKECGIESDDLTGWESKTYIGPTGYEFTEWFCPICSEPRFKGESQ